MHRARRPRFAIPGDIDLPTGGYAYDRRVLALLPEHGVAVAPSRAAGRVSRSPSAADLAETDAAARSVRRRTSS